MKWLLASVGFLALVAAACGGQPVAAPPPPLPPAAHTGPVYLPVAGGSSYWVIDSGTGQVARTLPAGTPSPDWRSLYRVSSGTVDVLDPATGVLAAAHPAPDWAEVVRTSAGGRWLVFARSGPWNRFQVQDASWKAAPVDVALSGSFTFDGISDDGQRLYLLERLGGDRYHVRLYAVGARLLEPYVIVDKSNVSEDMSGTALASFANRSGAMQLTLYQRSPGQGQAFVHALPIGQAIQWAFCTDLPGPSSGWAFAPAPDGLHFYAVNPAGGRVVELDAPDVGPPGMREGHLAAARVEGVPALAVSPDGRTIFAATGRGVLAIDAATLAVRASGLAGQAVAAVAVAPDGSSVFAVTGSRLHRLDPRSLSVR